jgi:uncharacterized protein (TIGR00369 family)
VTAPEPAGLVVSSDYPPAQHVLRDLAIEVEHARGESRAWLRVTDPMCNASGRVHTGLVTVLIDAICGGLAAMTAAPEWIATADLTLHVTRPLDVAQLEAVARVSRAGRTTVVLEAELFDAQTSSRVIDGALGLATLTFSVLPRREGNPVMAPAPDDASPRRAFFDGAGGFVQDAYAACGFVDRGSGRVEMEMSDYILNSIGGVQGGVLGALIDASACSALGAGFEVADLHLVYLALARRGPIVATADVLVRGDDHATVSVDVHDIGAARGTTVATCSGVRW